MVKVSLFAACLNDALFPEVAEATVRVLARAGVTVSFPPQQTCCGQPAFNSGYWEEARSGALTLLDAFEDADFVVAPSGSCVGMVKHYYPKLFPSSPELSERARNLAEKIYEFSQFLVNVLQVERLGAVFPYEVAYHPSCHGSRILGVKSEPLTLLKSVEGITLRELPGADECCGFGGTFSVKMGAVSAGMVTSKSDAVAASGAEVLTGLDMGCLMNIGGYLQRRGENIRVLHLAQLLDEGVRLGGS